MNAADYNRRVRDLRPAKGWWADAAYQRAKIELAGGGCNEHGVYVTPEREVVATSGKARGVVYLAAMPCGLWVGSHSLDHNALGHSSLPNVCGPAFDTREECRRTQIAHLAEAVQGSTKHVPISRDEKDRRGLATKLRAICDQPEGDTTMAKTKAKKPKPARATKAAEVRAPAPAPSGSRAGVLPVTALRPSPTNPRKSFPAESLQALADSIKSVGLRQRLLVRPIAEEGHPAPRYDEPSGMWVGVDHFEIVAGERRFRASQLAGLDAVPVDVANLDDDQVLLVQLVENDQREDVRPSEQAAAYRRLADAGRTAEAIAADTGKGLSFVRGLLRLGRLPAWALAAVDAGTLPRATAELVARVPGEKGRARCAWFVASGVVDPRERIRDWDDEEEAGAVIAKGVTLETEGQRASVLSYRDTKDLIRNYFQVELKGCAFDRKALALLDDVADCDSCPKLAGNDEEATAEGVRADVCLDPDCYRRKVEAHRQIEITAHSAKGIEYVETDERFSPGLAPRGYCDPTCEAWQSELHADFPIGTKRRDEKLKDLIGKAELQRYVAFAATGKPRVLVRTADVRKALQSAGVLKKVDPRPKAASKAPPGSAIDAELDRLSFDDAVEKESARRTMGAVCQAAEETCRLLFVSSPGVAAPVVDLLRLLLAGVVGATWAASARQLELRRGAGRDTAASLPATLDGPELFGMFAELVAGRKLLGWHDPIGDDAFWSFFGVDREAIEKATRSELKKAVKETAHAV